MPDRELQVGVKVLLRNPSGKYLVLHRSSIKYPEVPNPWEIPGGRIQIGVALLENLSREVAEETGLNITGTPHLIDAQDILRIPERHVVRLTYEAQTRGDPVLSEEHTEYQWMTLDEIGRLPGLDIYLKKTLELLQTLR